MIVLEMTQLVKFHGQFFLYHYNLLCLLHNSKVILNIWFGKTVQSALIITVMEKTNLWCFL